MPWSRLRVNRPTGGDDRRCSVADTSAGQDDGNQPPRSVGLQQESHTGAMSPSPLRISHEPSEPLNGMDEPIHSPTESDSIHPPRPHRFSMLRYRHASDPQLSKTAKEQAANAVPPVPLAPSIITTAPTESYDELSKRKSFMSLPRRFRAPELPMQLSPKVSQPSMSARPKEPHTPRRGLAEIDHGRQDTHITIEEPQRVRGLNAPPAYGDESNSSLALPVSRLSESSRSDGSGDHGLYATTTTTHTVSTTTTFFRLPRRKKRDKGPLFPLPAKTPPLTSSSSANATPRASTSRRPSDSPRRTSPPRTPPHTAVRLPTESNLENGEFPSPLPSPPHITGETVSRNSTTSAPSGRSSPAPPAGHLARSSTRASLRLVTDGAPTYVNSAPQSGRTSTSTAGRASLGGVFALSRLRQNSEPQPSRQHHAHPPLPGTPVSAGSKSHSFTLARELVTLPERQEGETPAKYLIRLEENISRHIIATLVSQKNDEFFKNVLRSYMRGFKFFGEPLDMAVRKMLMEVELPKETQQIDRVLQSFANRYHECNPGVYASPDEAYFIAFSILILHTDVFNKNNKNKMQKQDYTKNARGQGVADEILECFYDNISYTPFIHVEGDLDINAERIGARKLRKNMFSRPSTDSMGRPMKEPVDPYTVILDGRLDSLRPPLKEVMNLEDHYNYLGTASALNLTDLSRSFYRSGVLQIVSSRSRPEAFTSPETMANPADAHPGVVAMKVTKVGILWRKDTKKKKGRSPWQEWGAILTGASLYFFRNHSWVKSLIQQHDSHHRLSLAGGPCIFRPPLEQFKPDVLMPTQDAVALVDTDYKKHKNAMLFIRHGGIEETFLADSESDMNDWLAKLNYAAAFRTAGIQTREVLGGSKGSRRQSSVQRQDSEKSSQSLEPALSQAAVSLDSSAADLARRVQIARRQLLDLRIAEADEKLTEAQRQLEAQLRNARHLQILAPIQNKTREQIVLAAGGMAAKVKWMRMDIWRTKCHRDILAKDLDEDLRDSNEAPRRHMLAAPELVSTSPSGSTSRPIETQDGLVTPARQLPRSNGAGRPATQPSPERNFNFDDVFAPVHSSPQNKSVVGHKAKASWELPPLSFQPTRTSLASRSSATSSQLTRHPLVPQASSRSVSDNSRRSDNADPVNNVAAPALQAELTEQELLEEAGVLDSDSPTIVSANPPQTPEDEKAQEGDKTKTPDPEVSENRTRIRRSLHRTLRETAHVVPTHHRSKKGKDSASSANIADDGTPKAENEGLARTTGSFTVHGKKASVITFGSEWQGMSPEERLNLRKQAHNDGAKLTVPSAIDDEDLPIGSDPVITQDRPVSTVSTSTEATAATASTTKSAAFEEALEKPVQEPENETVTTTSSD